jgi:5-hydroxyisourate hydrolase
VYLNGGVSVSSHVLDAVAGAPAVGMTLRLEQRTDGWSPVGSGLTDDDGRWRRDDALPAGVYRLAFDTGGWFASRGQATFYPEVSVVFEIVDATSHHHVPLLLSPFAYSTYRGS